MDDLYREQIIERYKNPLHKGVLDPHDFSYEDDNPLCGDRIRIDLRVNADDVVTEAAFSGQGCSISLASADLLVESVIGKSLDDVRAMSKEDILGMLGMGYQAGIAGSKRSLIAPITALSFAIVVAAIASLDRPDSGLISTPRRG